MSTSSRLCGRTRPAHITDLSRLAPVFQQAPWQAGAFMQAMVDALGGDEAQSDRSLDRLQQTVKDPAMRREPAAAAVIAPEIVARFLSQRRSRAIASRSLAGTVAAQKPLRAGLFQDAMIPFHVLVSSSPALLQKCDEAGLDDDCNKLEFLRLFGVFDGKVDTALRGEYDSLVPHILTERWRNFPVLCE
jgi:hypothetical protein